MRLLQATLVSQVWLGSAQLSGDGGTVVGKKLNDLIHRSKNGGIYNDNGLSTSNKGVLVRVPDFFDDGGNQQVKPATFWHNDIFSPSQMYPTVESPWCPNDGWDGFYNQGSCGGDGPWTYATVGVVITDAMDQAFTDFKNIQRDDWENGVFYASDANAADARCIYREEWNGYDCPGGWSDWDSGYQPDSSHFGSGVYSPGNPDKLGFDNGGGGSGCHFDSNQGAIDQPDAYASKGNLVGDANCQCNSAYKRDWGSWVDAWVQHSQQKGEFQSRTWLAGGDLAPVWAIDTAACWLTNPRDMIDLQNALFWKKFDWNNQLIPKSKWQDDKSGELRKYWGWNEVPVGKWIVDEPMSWDSIIIKLPADTCEDGQWGRDDHPSCLHDAAKNQLEKDLDQFVSQGKLVPGQNNLANRPGSYVLFVREYGDDSRNWQREFFCANWDSPNGQYHIKYKDNNCWIEKSWASLAI